MNARLNISSILDTVQGNCHISDARHAGNYTMCIFLLKMREFYRWEQGIPLTGEIAKSDFGDWLLGRESQWDEVEERDYAPLPMIGGDVDCYEAAEINRQLTPLGYVYSSGHGLFGKPNFYVGKLLREERHGPVQVYLSSCEYARDMEAPPAMMRDNSIFIRYESLRRAIWEQIEEWQWSKSKPDTPLGRLMSRFGGKLDMERVLDQLTDEQVESIIWHEMGEVMAGEQLGEEWEDMLHACPRSKSEFIIRAIRDNLADCLVTLPSIFEQDEPTLIHYYFSHFRGMRKTLFPELVDAYERWVESGDIGGLESVVEQGGERWKNLGEDALVLYRRGDTEKLDALFPELP